MKAKSIKGKSTAAISTGLIESMSDGFRPTIAIVFEYGKSTTGKYDYLKNTCCLVALKEK